jgi:Tn3 transposase DDE domain
MSVEANYTDIHGQSEIGFGIRLLGFDLLPRIKQINRVRLYRPTAGEPELMNGAVLLPPGGALIDGRPEAGHFRVQRSSLGRLGQLGACPQPGDTAGARFVTLS